MKIAAILFIGILPAFAKTPRPRLLDLVQVESQINVPQHEYSSRPVVTAQQSGAMLTPKRALELVLSSGPLKLLGMSKFLNDLTPSCVFRNTRVTVVFDYCSQKESSAMGMTVFSPEEGVVQFYAEGDKAVSVSKRNSYFDVNLVGFPTGISSDTQKMTYAQFVQFYKQWNEDNGPHCTAAAGAPGTPATSGCTESMSASSKDGWQSEAKDFVQNLHPKWPEAMQVVNRLRKKARGA